MLSVGKRRNMNKNQIAPLVSFHFSNSNENYTKYIQQLTKHLYEMLRKKRGNVWRGKILCTLGKVERKTIIYDTVTKQILNTLCVSNSMVFHVAPLYNNRFYVNNRQITIWGTNSSYQATTIKFYSTSQVKELQNGLLLIIDYAKNLHILNCQTHAEINSAERGVWWVEQLSDKRAATAHKDAKCITIKDETYTTLLKSIRTHVGLKRIIEYRPGVLLGSAKNTLHLIDIDSEKIDPFAEHITFASIRNILLMRNRALVVLASESIHVINSGHKQIAVTTKYTPLLMELDDGVVGFGHESKSAYYTYSLATEIITRYDVIDSGKFDCFVLE